MVSQRTDPFLSLADVCVDYGEFRAIRGMSLDVGYGEIHAIVGEHGAGKSSLGQAMSGMQRITSGQIRVDGHRIPSFSIKGARRLGIRMVYQIPYLNEYFSVAENLFYTHKRRGTMGLYNKRQVVSIAQDYLDSLDIPIRATEQLSALNLSDRTVIDILRNVYEKPRLLILDEALERLSTESYERILPVLMELRSGGTSLLTITHKIDDVYDFADRVTVVKNGELLLTDLVDNVGKINLIRMTYTQVGADSHQARLDREFYQFLRYNEAILRHLPVNIVVVDDGLRIKMVNEHFSGSFSLGRADVLNRELRAVFSGNTGAVDTIETALLNEETRTLYNVELTIGGRSTVNNIKTLPVRDGRTLVGSIIIIEDVTEHDRLQKQLILSEKLGSVGLLAAGVAHEINNPLEIVYNYLSYAKRRVTDVEVREALEKVSDEMESISRIVSSLVSFGDSTLTEDARADAVEVIGDLVSLLRFSANSRHITISFNPQRDALVFRGNPDEFKQVVLNLVKNGFEAMPAGGRIDIGAEPMVTDLGPTVRVVISDEGPGIDPAQIDSIFLPFYSTKQRSPNNLGLGLSISYRLLEKIGGKISVANGRERGSVFTIDLPAVDASGAPEPFE